MPQWLWRMSSEMWHQLFWYIYRHFTRTWYLHHQLSSQYREQVRPKGLYFPSKLHCFISQERPVYNKNEPSMCTKQLYYAFISQVQKHLHMEDGSHIADCSTRQTSPIGLPNATQMGPITALSWDEDCGSACIQEHRGKYRQTPIRLEWAVAYIYDERAG